VAGLLLDDNGSGHDPPTVGNVTDPKAQQVTPEELAVDGEVE
jgi:hypothetical protein